MDGEGIPGTWLEFAQGSDERPIRTHTAEAVRSRMQWELRHGGQQRCSRGRNLHAVGATQPLPVCHLTVATGQKCDEIRKDCLDYSARMPAS